MRAWVSRETVVDGKRKYAKCDRGTKGAVDGDQFRVNYIDPSGKRQTVMGLAPFELEVSHDLATVDYFNSVSSSSFVDSSSRTYRRFTAAVARNLPCFE